MFVCAKEMLCIKTIAKANKILICFMLNILIVKNKLILQDYTG
jgi:hypothetical protein